MDLSKYGAQCPILTCDKHQDKEFNMYCHTCEKFICIDCVENEHANHKCDKVSDIATAFCQEIPNVVHEKTQAIVSKDQQDLEILYKSKEINRNSVKRRIERINCHRDVLHALINSEMDAMIVTCREEADDRETELENCETEVKKHVQEMEVLFKFLNEYSQTLSYTNLVQLKVDFENKLKRVNRIPVRNKNELYYVKGEVFEDMLKSVIGSLNQNDPYKITMSMRTSFVVGETTILSVLPVSSNSAWVLRYNSTRLELVGMNGNVKDTREVNEYIGSFDVTEYGNIIYSSTGGKIMKVDKSGTLSLVKNTLPLKPLCVTVAQNGDLLVAAVDKLDFKPKIDSRRIVQRIKTSGEVVTTYEFDADGTTRLFTYPLRVKQNCNGDICVVDITGVFAGRLCVLGMDGVLRFIFNGLDLNEDFYPQDVVCDCTSNVIVNDINNLATYLLSPTGQFVKYLTNDQIEFTPSLGFHESALWVGCSNGIIKVFKYNYDTSL